MGEDKIKTKLVICGNVVRHAVSFLEEEMACSEQESVTVKIWSDIDKLSMGTEVVEKGILLVGKSEILKQKVCVRLS